ncbi:MAG: hypothetical protein KDK39_20200, partial [Leptospiraceae bacterium]|nr:hypothetical protein [Leptospiraceae bacterium]
EELSSIAQSDRILAGVLFNTGNGGVSRVFRDSRGRYMLVKVERRRPIPITKVRELIKQRLYYEKQQTVFDDWIKEKRTTIAIIKVDA